MIRHAITTLLLLAAPFALAGRNASGAETSPPATTEENRPDVVCGPRCVQYILKHYGQQVELHDLIQELQWPNLEAGSNLADLQKSLNKRGIHTAAIQLSPGAKLDWPEPVLVHLKLGTSITPETLGHFVVWLPSSTNDIVHLWFGPKGVHQGTNARFAGICSGGMLLISRNPIADSQLAVYGSVREWIASRVLWTGAVLFVCASVYRLIVNRCRLW